ncbi:MAG: ACP S-malonyltransferase [Alphaproteobacteria bacterium]|jgi:[acyl-carrier-protein] S-malonyltransferase|nr:ACP S-malonyltransferase [Alphaproteobacteria bacterium]
MTRAFLFPGQATQAVGMGQDLADAFTTAKLVFEEVDEALKQNLSRLMFQGPEDELLLTENAQPAILTVSLAVATVLEKDCNINLVEKAAYVAGHSLGEYSALAAVGSLRLQDAARLVKLRGRSMQEAVPVGMGAMAALMGLELDVVKEVAAAAAGDEVCDAANDNAPGQVVVSGHASAVERAVEIAGERGAKRCVMLPVSAPFHSALMQPVADIMAEALAETEITAPRVPVVANVTAEQVTDPDAILRNLVEQVTGMVRWRESIAYMKDNGVDSMVETGYGKVMSGLVRRVDREIATSAVGTPGDIEEFAKTV